MVEFNSDEGRKRLQRSQFNNDFYQLVNYYQPQVNPLYCGVASGVMMLNALKGDIKSQKAGQVVRPSGKVIAFPSYTQEGFFNDKTDLVKDRAVIGLKSKDKAGKYDAGISLEDFAKILAVHGLKAKVEHADDDSSVEKFRRELKRYMRDSEHYIVTNFKGRLFGQKTGGHISPVVAYDEDSDSLLVMDVALHKNKWFWVGVEEFYKAMHSFDGDSFRGWVVVWK